MSEPALFPLMETTQRPAWELMRLTETVPLEDDDSAVETPSVLTKGSLVLRVNTKAMLKALYWPHLHNYNHIPGLAFCEKESGRFDPEMGFLFLDKHLEAATDAEDALPKKCLVCGAEAHNRGLFYAGEPVFFCDMHYSPRMPLLVPAEGYREIERPDRA